MKKLLLPLLVLIVLFLSSCMTYPNDITPSTDTPSVATQEENKAEQAVDDYLESVAQESKVEKEEIDINEMYDKVKTGMTFNEVRAILGEPGRVQKMESDIGDMIDVSQMEELTGQKIKTKTSMEYWYYTKGFNILQVGFTDGKVSSRMVT